VGKPFSENPTSPVGYDCLRASTGFCANSQRMSVSEAPAETGGGDLFPAGRMLLLLPLKSLRASSGSLEFLRLEQLVTVARSTQVSVME
jgi:hypothetical protein